MKKIYNSNSYKEFNIQKEYKSIITNVYGSEDAIIIAEEYFVATNTVFNKSPVYMISDNDSCIVDSVHVEFSKTKLLSRHNLILGKLNTLTLSSVYSELFKTNYFYFQKKLLALQLGWSCQFLNCIYEHLKSRKAEGRMLVNHGSIKMAIGEIVSLLKSVEKMLDMVSVGADSAGCFSYASTQILTANNLLAKLAGGRAFLQGNVIEMLLVFSVLANIYFGNGDSNGK